MRNKKLENCKTDEDRNEKNDDEKKRNMMKNEKKTAGRLIDEEIDRKDTKMNSINDTERSPKMSQFQKLRKKFDENEFDENVRKDEKEKNKLLPILNFKPRETMKRELLPSSSVRYEEIGSVCTKTLFSQERGK